MDCKSMTTPMASNLMLLSDDSSDLVDSTMYHQMIGSFMYLTSTRPNIFFVVNTFIQFLNDSRHVHLIYGNHIMRYLKGTIAYGIKCEENQRINPEGYVDLYWKASAIDRKSTSRCCFSMASCVISWFSRKKFCVALSTAEA